MCVPLPTTVHLGRAPLAHVRRARTRMRRDKAAARHVQLGTFAMPLRDHCRVLMETTVLKGTTVHLERVSALSMVVLLGRLEPILDCSLRMIARHARLDTIAAAQG